MKSLTTFLFIFLASSSWRCDEPEDTIDCADAAKQMIGTWTGRTDYTNSSATGTSHKITLSIIILSIENALKGSLGDSMEILNSF